MNFWQELKIKTQKEGRPLYCLAPMADVTDRAFRQIIAKYGKPDVMWTEFVSVDGLVHEVAREKLKIDLMYTETERPIVAQLFSSNPENMKSAVKYCIELGFDGIDINMGCPDKTIEKQGAGASMIKTPEVARAVIASARVAIKESGKNIPLSVKTRVGYNKPEIDTWVRMLLEQDLDALTIHARTRKDLSKVPANWDYIKQVVKMRDDMKKKTLIIGNGDVLNLEDGNEKQEQTNCDGVMIGRAIFGNPWIFANLAHKNCDCQIERPVAFLPELERDSLDKDFTEKNNVAQSRNSADAKYCAECATLKKSRKNGTGIISHWHKFLQFLGFKNRYWLRAKTGVSKEEKLRVLFEHAKLFDELLGGVKSFAIMKKHFKAYVNGFDGAKELRHKLMESKDFQDFKRNLN